MEVSHAGDYPPHPHRPLRRGHSAAFVDHLFYLTGTTLENANTLDHYTALAYAIRDRMLARMVVSGEFYQRQGAKTVAYLLAEFLTGPHLANNILNLKLGDKVHEAISALASFAPHRARLGRTPTLSALLARSDASASIT